jgi:GT2 family glycosyltransferase
MQLTNSIAVLMTCFNRREKTLNCLKALYNCLLPEGHTIDVYLVDDECTDGTHEAVAQQFPRVNIIRGTGNLFWNRGMRLAWETAASTKDYDFYLWLNDDTYLYENAIEDIFSVFHTVNETDVAVCASLQSPTSKKATYGGWDRNGLVTPDATPHECLTMNGNCVLIPRSVYQKTGNLDHIFHHAIGDLDYGYRARKAGAKIYMTPCFVGMCEKNPTPPKWWLKDTPFIERIKTLYSPLGHSEPVPFFIFEKRHFGIFVALKHFISIHIRLFFPELWKLPK